ncbi:chemotaxis protein CheB [Altererythrobacter sp. GH1-8]|uniref:chemotaxis protein CheB n=1 Tax=Altererythrobacter sp. GH1-8 TaxID=3349333 RepID=UPI00374D9883
MVMGFKALDNELALIRDHIDQQGNLPVVMLSSITQSGTGTAQKALALGAVDCFPKPLNASPEAFAESVAKLGDIVVRAANGEVGSAANGSGSTSGSYTPGNSVVVLAGGAACLDTLRQVLAALPANCPPTLVLTDCSMADAQAFKHKAGSYAACSVEVACADQLLVPGTVYLAGAGDRHILIEDAQNPVIRMVERDPVGGFRPSADLLMGALARSDVQCVAGMLEGDGEDGARGVKMLSDQGREVLLQQVSMGGKPQRIDAAKAQGVGGQPLSANDLAAKILELTQAT